MHLILTAGILCAGLLWSCAGWFVTGEPPEVLVTDLTPLESTAFEQRLNVALRVRNPNDYDLQATGIDFRLDLNGKRLARGLANKEFTVPRLGDTIVTVETTTSMLDIARQLFTMRHATELAYAVNGVLYLQGGKLPFQHAGLLLDKEQLSGFGSQP